MLESALVTALFALVFAATVNDASAAYLAFAVASTAATSSATATSTSAVPSAFSSDSNAFLPAVLRLLLFHSVRLFLRFVLRS